MYSDDTKEGIICSPSKSTSERELSPGRKKVSND